MKKLRSIVKSIGMHYRILPLLCVMTLVISSTTMYAQVERGRSVQIWNPTNPAHKFSLTNANGTESWFLNMPSAKPAVGGIFWAGPQSGDTVPFRVTSAGASTDILTGGATPSFTSGKGLFWSTTGNPLTGVLPEPNERLGSTNNYDLVFQSGGNERFRIKPFLPGIHIPEIGTTARTLISIGNTPFLDLSGALTSTSADGNVFLGASAGNTAVTGLQNIGIGPNAVGSVTSGWANIGIGRGALLNCTDAGLNIAIGTNSLLSTTTGASSNVAIGYTALSGLTTGSDNIVIGTHAAADQTTSTRNVAIGFSSMRVSGVNNLGSDNVAIGTRSLSNIDGGTDNVAVGNRAGQGLISGTVNTFIGPGAGFIDGQPQRNRSTAIGAYASVNADDAVVIGGIAGFNGATVSQFVGIGRRTPLRRFHVAAAGTDYVAGTPLVRDEFLIGSPNTDAYAAGDGVMVANADGDHFKKRGASAQAALGLFSLVVNGAAAVAYDDVAVGFDLHANAVITGTVVNPGGGAADAIPIVITEIDEANDVISFVTNVAIGVNAQVHFIFVQP